MENTAISTTTAKPKAKIRGNKKTEKEKDPKGKATKGKGKEAVLNYAKFQGQGLNYKCKLFGFVEVPGARGDLSSVQAIHKLKQQAKQLKKGNNEHKLKIIFNITLKGVRVFNEKTQTIEHEHPIHKISFISHDPEDRHIFGYIYSPPRTTEEARKYYLFAIKAEKSADIITCQLYELFQVVFKMQENKKIKTRDDPTVNQRPPEKYSQPLEPLQDKMLLEMSTKLGGDQQYSTEPEEHLYAEPTFVKSIPTVSSKPHYAVPSNLPATRVSNDSESRENEIEHGSNGISEVKSETLPSSSPFTQDPFSENGKEENSKDPKEASAFSQVFSDNTSTSTANEDSAFEPDIDSGTSSMSAEPKADDAFQFHAEFPPFENGFSGSVNAAEISNDFEETVFSDKHSSSDQFQFDAFNSNRQFDASSDTNQHFEEPLKKNEENDVEARSLSTSSVQSDEVENIEKVNENEVGSVTKSFSLLEQAQCDEFSSDKLTVTKPNDTEKKESSDEKLSSPAVSFENVDHEMKETERNSENENDNSVSKNVFEVKFETENEENITAENSEKDVFSSFTAEDFPNQDPFSDCSVAAQPDKSSSDAFPLDDPFSPCGGTNKERLTDPFADNDNIFSCDFNTSGDKNNEDVFGEDEDNKSDISSQTNQNENDREEDIFEAIFEAKMEVESEEITEQQDESQVVIDLLSSKENNVDMNVQVDLDNEELDRNEEEETSAAAVNDIQMRNDITEDYPRVIVDISEQVENTIAQEVEPGGNDDQEESSDVNIFDMSTSDDYVTLKTAVQATCRPLSPSEFTPPPLPPRPTLHIHIEPSSSPGIPKQPPALPPRPSNQSLDFELRRPPELPPRVDLEEQNSNMESFSDDVENIESTPSNNTSPLFQTNFDSFDFYRNLESNTNMELEGSKAVAFDARDPFKDPFVGSDPFQTPAPADPFQTPGPADPFASSASFDRDYKQDSEGFDPFSGDDPFAATNFDSSNSSFQTRLSFDEAKDDKSSDKFADFSGFSTAFN